MEMMKTEEPVVAERGVGGQTSDRRLFMRLVAYTGCRDTPALASALEASGVESVLYEDLSDPLGVAVLMLAEDPSVLVEAGRVVLQSDPFAALTPKPAMTMMGRTYALGYERDLDEVLLNRPRRHAFHSDWPWVVWYPLRRSGAFQALPREQQMEILKEHGQIGIAYGAADYAHDIRLACHGLDTHDNDFVVGLMGKELAPLSKVVERMRKTQQTSKYLEKLGPFFIGRAAWRSNTA